MTNEELIAEARKLVDESRLDNLRINRDASVKPVVWWVEDCECDMRPLCSLEEKPIASLFQQSPRIIRRLADALERAERDAAHELQRADLLEGYLAKAARERDALRTELTTTEQTLGRALGYPRYCDDQKNFPGATDADGVCVGEHTPETLAIEAARRIEALTAQLDAARAELAGINERWQIASTLVDIVTLDHSTITPEMLNKHMREITPKEEELFALRTECHRLRHDLGMLGPVQEEVLYGVTGLWGPRCSFNSDQKSSRKIRVLREGGAK